MTTVRPSIKNTVPQRRQMYSVEAGCVPCETTAVVPRSLETLANLYQTARRYFSQHGILN